MVEVVSLHLGVDHMDGESWLVFGLILAPAFILLMWTALTVHRDAQEMAGTDHPEPPRDDRSLH